MFSPGFIRSFGNAPFAMSHGSWDLNLNPKRWVLGLENVSTGHVFRDFPELLKMAVLLPFHYTRCRAVGRSENPGVSIVMWWA
jgi:hypothetical protein